MKTAQTDELVEFNKEVDGYNSKKIVEEISPDFQLKGFLSVLNKISGTVFFFSLIFLFICLIGHLLGSEGTDFIININKHIAKGLIALFFSFFCCLVSQKIGLKLGTTKQTKIILANKSLKQRIILYIDNNLEEIKAEQMNNPELVQKRQECEQALKEVYFIIENLQQIRIHNSSKRVREMYNRALEVKNKFLSQREILERFEATVKAYIEECRRQLLESCEVFEEMEVNKRLNDLEQRLAILEQTTIDLESGVEAAVNQAVLDIQHRLSTVHKGIKAQLESSGINLAAVSFEVSQIKELEATVERLV